MGKIYKLDVSRIPATERSAPQRVLPQLQNHDEALLYRESISQAFRTQERQWEYLPMFCEAEKLREGLAEALPSQSTSDTVQPKISHISAQYRTFVAYSVESTSENREIAKKNSFVFFGKKGTTQHDKPEILPSLQNRGVIQLSRCN
jgi:SCF-associated factor 1